MAMNCYLVISALGKDRPGIVNELSKTILDYGGNISDSRMTVLGGDFALILMVSGNWNAISKIEQRLPGLEEKLGLTICAKRTEPREPANTMVPYVVDVVSMDHPGIVHDVADFFSSRSINIENMNTGTYAAAHTGTAMFSLNLTISVPANRPIAQLREEFNEFCDTLNLDAILEPEKR